MMEENGSHLYFLRETGVKMKWGDINVYYM